MRSPMMTEKWRKFAGKVGGVVLGVLIALGIGEIADTLRWKARVQKSMSAIHTELSGNRFNIVERRVTQSCIDARLAAIGRLLKTARTTGMLPDVHSVGRMGARLTESAAYEAAKSQGVPLHINATKARDLALLYDGSAMFAALSESERGYWTTLRLLENAPGRINDGMLTSQLQAWSSATAQASLIGLVAQQMDDSLAQTGITIEYNAVTPNRDVLMKKVRDGEICRPLLADGRPLAA